ncbi:hypothetical protein [Streptomyces sp. NPDC020362]|uniref:antibiotic biosynthesis monooxygenase family protein n=1 Tax=unclassified Streptomyces TaxID=2593676 RepID=UPI000AA975FE
MAERDLGGPVTVINRFEVKGDVGEFERLFREHSQFLRRRDDFDFLVTTRLVDRPQVYVHLSHWRTLRAFLDTVHDATFLRHVRRLEPLVVVEVDQAVSVGRVLRDDALVGAENVALIHADVHGDWRAFEGEFAELCTRAEQLGGFGGGDLLRSTISPFAYTGLLWWRDAEACDRALGTEASPQVFGHLADTARITVDRAVHVAYERTIERTGRPGR